MSKSKSVAKKPPQPLLLLEWEDASVLGGHSWTTREDLYDEAEKKQFLNRTVGWLLRETKKYVIVVAQIAVDDEGNGHEYDLAMYIPKSLIRKRRILS